jgi:hypothetical protein
MNYPAFRAGYSAHSNKKVIARRGACYREGGGGRPQGPVRPPCAPSCARIGFRAAGRAGRRITLPPRKGGGLLRVLTKGDYHAHGN